MKFKAFHEQGQALLELVIVMAILVLILVALVSLIVVSLAGVQKSRLRARATALAEQGLENVRRRREQYLAENNWEQFKRDCPGNINSWAGADFGGVTADGFSPQATCNIVSGIAVIVATVGWEFGGKSDYQVVLETELGPRTEGIFR